MLKAGIPSFISDHAAGQDQGGPFLVVLELAILDAGLPFLRHREPSKPAVVLDVGALEGELARLDPHTSSGVVEDPAILRDPAPALRDVNAVAVPVDEPAMANPGVGVLLEVDPGCGVGKDV